MTRRLYVGDVQGCLEPLERLLVEAGFEPGVDRLILAGDLVNKGPDNVGVLRLARRLGAEAVLGNHDVALLDIAAGRRPLRDRHTIGDVLDAPDRDELIEWLAARPLLIVDDDVCVVHAALHPRWSDLSAIADRLGRRVVELLRGGDSPFVDDEVRFAMTARYCAPDGAIADSDWPPPAAPFGPWTDYYTGDATVVFGHWARAGLQVGPRWRGLDTGCVYGHSLTGWIAEEDRLISVPCDPLEGSA